MGEANAGGAAGDGPVSTRADRRHWRQFRTYWFGHLLSVTGDWFTILALPFLAVELSDSAALVGLVAAAELAATPLLGLRSGHLADRLPPRATLLATDLTRAGLLGALAWWVSAGTPPLWVLPVTAFVLAALADLHDAAENVMVSSVVPTELLVRANGRFEISGGLGHVFGATAAGALVAVGPGSALMMDAATFLLAASAVAAMGTVHVPRNEQPHEAPWRAALRELRAEGHYWRVVATMAIANMTTACFLGPFVVFADVELGLDEWQTGLTFAAMGLGGAVTGLALGRVQVLPPVVSLIASASLGITTAVVALADSWPITLVMFFAAGMILALGITTVGSLRHASFRPGVQGRIAMATRLAFTVTVVPGVLALGWLSDRTEVGPANAFLLFAFPSAAAAVLGIALRIDRLTVPRRPFAHPHAPDPATPDPAAPATKPAVEAGNASPASIAPERSEADADLDIRDPDRDVIDLIAHALHAVAAGHPSATEQPAPPADDARTAER